MGFAFPGTYVNDSTSTSLPYASGEKVNAIILNATRNLGKMAKSFSDIFTHAEEEMPSSEVWSETDSEMGIDMPYNTLINDTTISKPIAIDNDSKHPGKRISLAEAYERAGHIYENAEAQRQVLREQEARLFFGLLGDE